MELRSLNQCYTSILLVIIATMECLEILAGGEGENVTRSPGLLLLLIGT